MVRPVPRADARARAGGDRALELEPGRTEAAVALARLLIERGERDDAEALLRGRPGFAAEGLLARLRLADDPALADAFTRFDAGDQHGGLDGLIAALAAEADQDRKDEIRRAVVGILDELGVEHPLARDARRKLAAALY